MKKKKLIRKTHRYLGLFIGIQLLLWTISGLYFSWTNIDRIHGDHYKYESYSPKAFHHLTDLSNLVVPNGISHIQIREINGNPYYWINNERLYNAKTGEIKQSISEQEALDIAQAHMNPNLTVSDIKLITNVNDHHEYREKLLPAYVISYQHKANIKAYVSEADGKFQTVRHKSWRVFDFLWMVHTMDYKTRDNFNTLLLRAFSLLALFTVLSGFFLWFGSSGAIKRILNAIKRPKIH